MILQMFHSVNFSLNDLNHNVDDILGQTLNTWEGYLVGNDNTGKEVRQEDSKFYSKCRIVDMIPKKVGKHWLKW